MLVSIGSKVLDSKPGFQIAMTRAVRQIPISADGREDAASRPFSPFSETLGQPLPTMPPDLQTVLARQDSPIAERRLAFEALLRLGDAGKAAIRNVFDTQLGNSESDLRLRATILQACYGDPYGPDDVIALVQASLSSTSTMIGLLLGLAEKLPDCDLPAILDGIEPSAEDVASSNGSSWEAGSFYARILVRGWSKSEVVEPIRVMGWLHKRIGFRGSFGEQRARGLQAAMQASPERLHRLAEDFFRRVPADGSRWLAIHDFHEATLFELKPDTLAPIVVQAMEAAEPGTERRLFLYEVAMRLSFQMAVPHAATVFDELYQRAENDPGLRQARGALVEANLPKNYFSRRPQAAHPNVLD